MATWVGVIVAANEREDFWTAVEPLGVTGNGEVGKHVLIDCGRAFGAVQDLGKTIASRLDTETIAFIVQTVSDAHAIWVGAENSVGLHFRAGELLRARDVDAQAVAIAKHGHGPRPTADGAVFDERALRVRIDVELDPFATVRTTNADRVLHVRRRVSRRASWGPSTSDACGAACRRRSA